MTSPSCSGDANTKTALDALSRFIDRPGILIYMDVGGAPSSPLKPVLLGAIKIAVDSQACSLSFSRQSQCMQRVCLRGLGRGLLSVAFTFRQIRAV